MAQSCFSHFIWAWSPLCNIQEIPGACEQLTWICSTGSYWQYTFYALTNTAILCTRTPSLTHSCSCSLSLSRCFSVEHYWHDCLNIQHCQSSQIRWVNNNSNKHSRLYTYGRVWSGCSCVMSCAIHVWAMKRKCIEQDQFKPTLWSPKCESKKANPEEVSVWKYMCTCVPRTRSINIRLVRTSEAGVYWQIET